MSFDSEPAPSSKLTFRTFDSFVQSRVCYKKVLAMDHNRFIVLILFLLTLTCTSIGTKVKERFKNVPNDHVHVFKIGHWNELEGYSNPGVSWFYTYQFLKGLK